jgi:hypothetical protein
MVFRGLWKKKVAGQEQTADLFRIPVSSVGVVSNGMPKTGNRGVTDADGRAARNQTVCTSAGLPDIKTSKKKCELSLKE